MDSAAHAPSITERFDQLFDLAIEADNLRLSMFVRPQPWFRRWWTAGMPEDPIGEWPAGAVRTKYYANVASHATEAEKSHPLFSIMANPYWAENLARFAGQYLVLDQPDVDAFLKIHAVKTRATSRFEGYGPKAQLAAVLLAASFLLTQVPEALFSKTGYTVYQTIVFLLVACTIYWVIVQWAAWRRVRAAMGRVDQLCEVVLTYLKIMYERGEDPRQTMPSPQPHAYVTRKGTKSSRRTRRPRAQ